MRAALVCREFKWTYDEYLDTPEWFIENAFLMLSEESHAQKSREVRNEL